MNPVAGLVIQSVRRPIVKPLIYGYIRVASEAPDDELDRIEKQMRRFAEVEGFCYATTFYEHQNGSQAALGLNPSRRHWCRMRSSVD
jgi:hypothetical protein